MRIVVDANIFFSAILSGGKPESIVRRIHRGKDDLFITDDIMAEINRVLRKPRLGLSEEKVRFIVTDMEDYGQKVTVSPEHRADGICRDPDDDMYLECAHAGSADYIITGDGDLLILKEHRSTKIVTPAEYLEIVEP